MRQLIQMFLIDVRMAMKHYMGSYMLVVPLLILLVLRFFIPTMESTSVTIAVVNEGPNAVDQKLIAELDRYARVKTYPTIEEMERKMRGTGEVEGLYRDPDRGVYVSVIERATVIDGSFSLASQVIRQYRLKSDFPDIENTLDFSWRVPEELSDRSPTSPVATMGGSIFFVFMIIISGFLIGLGVVDDKENGTDRALLVSPVTKADYFIGKSIYPLLTIALYAIISLLVLGLMHVNILQVYVMVLVSFSVTLLFGLLLGALAGNENEAIGIGKLLSWVVMLAILGGTLLPENWQWAVWWAPFYWIYNIMDGVLTESVTWSEIAWKSAITIALTGLLFLLFRKRIIRGLS